MKIDCTTALSPGMSAAYEDQQHVQHVVAVVFGLLCFLSRSVLLCRSHTYL